MNTKVRAVYKREWRLIARLHNEARNERNARIANEGLLADVTRAAAGTELWMQPIVIDERMTAFNWRKPHEDGCPLVFVA